MIVQAMNHDILIKGESIKEILRRNSNSVYLDSEPSKIYLKSTLGPSLGEFEEIGRKMGTPNAVNIEMPNLKPYTTSLDVSNHYTREDVTTEKADLRSSIKHGDSSKSNSNPPEPEIFDELSLMAPIINHAKRPKTVYELCNLEDITSTGVHQSEKSNKMANLSPLKPTLVNTA